MNKFIGQVAIVTGASSGIGRAIAVKLAEEGMKVAALARRENRLQELVESFTGNGSIKSYKCDVTDDAAVTKTYLDIEDNMGPTKVLINNAGISPKIQFMNFDIEVWRKIFDVNIFATFSCIKQLMAHVKKRESKELVHIININSISGQYIVSGDGAMIYTCSKQCVTLLTRNLIKHIATNKLNVRVTSLSPGFVESEILSAGGWEFDFASCPHLNGRDIAEATIAALSVPEDVIISELTIKAKGEQI